jgi:trimeric autotransporter adhesin
VVYPSLVHLKSVAIVSDPVNGTSNPKFIPGAIADYTLRITNTGQGTVGFDALVLEDPIPANSELFVGDLGGAGSGPVAFTNGSPSSALTWTFSSLLPLPVDDLFFYNGTTWNYQPSGTYDPNVTQIRLSPKGRMAANTGSGSPYFEVRFRVRVK